MFLPSFGASSPFPLSLCFISLHFPTLLCSFFPSSFRLLPPPSFSPCSAMADITHLPMEQLQDLEYCIDSNPPWVETIALAFQNYILMLGTSVMIPSILVPAMGGSDGDKARVIQTLLFVSGINTLLQALFGTRLPAVVGGSYAYVIPVAYIISDSSLQQITDHHERFIHTMRAIQGALIVASSIQIILGYSQVWGLFSRFFSPLGMSPVVGLVGLGLFQHGFPALGRCVEIGLPMLLLVIGLSQYLKHVRPFRDVPIFERFPVLICVTIVWIYSIILTASGAYRNRPDRTQRSCRTDRANLISTAPWFMFPYPLQWGPPTFSVGHCFAMMSAVLVSMVEFNAFVNAIFQSPATVGLIVAVFLDNTLEVEKSKKDRGMPWWVKFRTFRGDNRNEEFYTLPFNLNRFFPPT
ncbi:unnamed protein product [Linum tenue]|uniref:Nucleobase-ascorbate transporter 1 n=1 Tax=Linum tenue TaxID=586396 RepID=A0AAV0K7W3_9ROSI|nr:unnamed protein product [Linum tenue]